MYPRFYLMVSALLIFVSVHAQKSFYQEGNEYFEAGKYSEAVALFNQDKGAKRNKELLLKRVEANFQINDLQAAKNDIPDLLSFKTPPPETDLFIARIYHAEHNFLKAASYYKKYYRHLGKDDPEKPSIILAIKQCHTGSKLVFLSSLGKVENPGDPFNSAFDEFAPIQSPNSPNRFYFSSNRTEATGSALNQSGQTDPQYGHKTSDIFVSTLYDGSWLEPENLPGKINSEVSEILESIKKDGQKLIYSRHSKNEGSQPYINTYQDSVELQAADELFQNVYDPNSGDCDLFICNDSLFFFSSKRPGGLGGYDLYLTTYQYNGWTTPQNLGLGVNSPYDERGPFLSQDGREMYFSSNSPGSMGGYDVFKSIRNLVDNQWGVSENLGFGINSSQDDLNFKITADGYFAAFNSNRKSGIGGHDIYFFKWNERNKHMLGPLEGFTGLYDSNYLIGHPVSVVGENQLRGPNTGEENSNGIDSVDFTDLFKVYKPRNEADIQIDVSTDSLEFFVHPIYEKEDAEILNPENVKYLENIAGLMAKDPEIKLEISSHYFDEEIVDYNLFLSMKRAENIAAFLVQKGAKTAQIYLQAYGSNYPQRKKNRIEFAFKKGLNPNIQFIEKYSTEASLPFENKGLWYKLQIAESPDMYTNPILSLYKHSLLEWDDKNKLYLYSLGLYESYLLAKTAFDNLKAGGIEKVKIIPYLNGIRIQDSEIMELLAQYPDLKNYLAAYKN